MEINNLTFREILVANREKGEELKSSGSKLFKLNLLSNITANQLVPFVELTLRNKNIYGSCTMGDYNNIVQDSINFSKEDNFIIFWELSNLVPGLHYKSLIADENYFNSVIENAKAELMLVFSNLEKSPLVLFNKFSTLAFNVQDFRSNKFDELCVILNDFVMKNLPSNFVLVEIDKVIANVGVKDAINYDAYAASKALYTIPFYKEYVEYISFVLLNVTGKTKKAIIMDCDNTLWYGILGEEGFGGIEMSGETKKGTVYEEIQSHLIDLVRNGTLLGICSKNNEEDVLHVFAQHKNSLIKEKDITIKKINWNQKDNNLKAIADELNIGTDSLVFVDDSDFEINLVQSSLSEIQVLRVPDSRSLFPGEFRKLKRSFFRLTVTDEDRKKSEMYKEQSLREGSKKQFNSIEEYLASMEIKIEILKDDHSSVARISQMTQKTNQFNLTTKRYTENEISNLMDAKSSHVYGISVSDKFGDSGIAGLCIIKLDEKTAFIDTLLLSCRVIGRNIEKKLFDFLIEELKSIGSENVESEYLKTLKNSQVEKFYSSIGMTEYFADENQNKYKLEIANYKSSGINYIKIKSDERKA